MSLSYLQINNLYFHENIQYHSRYSLPSTPPLNSNIGKTVHLESQEVSKTLYQRRKGLSYHCNVFSTFFVYFIFVQDCSNNLITKFFCKKDSLILFTDKQNVGAALRKMLQIFKLFRIWKGVQL